MAIDCWVAGGQVGNFGDVWYRTQAVLYAGGGSTSYGAPWWTFAPYVDGANAFHQKIVPPC
ncbi:hypothetical protein [Streptomyces cinerochromogenes]|uniref:hypothetical protein n=1 Tax=Streptomyces cinerochromogenes TaxID=66422 RepID=UPI0033AC6DCD